MKGENLPANILIGQKVVEIREMTKQELDDEMWADHGNIYDKVFVIVLSNGMKIYPSRDLEGNGPGCFFGRIKDSFFFLETSK